jgi:hypothetical protein
MKPRPFFLVDTTFKDAHASRSAFLTTTKFLILIFFCDSYLVNGVNFDFANEYDFLRGDPIETLNIVLGFDQLPRFSCVANKTNICVRAAINQHSLFSKILWIESS